MEGIPLYRALNGERVQKAEIVVAPQHGDPYHLVCSGQALTDEMNRTIGAVVAMHDITERKQTEKKLKFLERRNQALLDHSPVCHKIVDLDFNLQYMSANGYKMLKLDHDAEMYGKPYPFDFFPESFRKEMTENLKKVKKTGVTITSEALTNDIEGNEVWLESSLIPVFDDNGKILVITDLGERPRSHALRGDANRTLCVRLSSQHVVKTEYYHSL